MYCYLAPEAFFLIHSQKKNSNCWISAGCDRRDAGWRWLSPRVTSPSSKGSFYVADYKVVLVTARPSQKHSTLEGIDQLSRHEITCKYNLVMFFPKFESLRVV